MSITETLTTYFMVPISLTPLPVETLFETLINTNYFLIMQKGFAGPKRTYIGLKNLSDVLEIFVVIPPLIYDCSAALFFLRHKNVAMCHIGSSIVAPSSSQ